VGAALAALFLSLTGCTTFLGPLPSMENDYKNFSFDQIKGQITFEKIDGSKIIKNVPKEAVIHADKIKGVTYENTNFTFEGIIGLDFVGSSPFILLGHRLVYLADFGFHDCLSISPDQTEPNAVGLGLDYRKGNAIIGFNIEEPFSILKDPKTPLRFGIFGSLPY
jgi:hypothetical protein